VSWFIIRAITAAFEAGEWMYHPSTAVTAPELSVNPDSFVVPPSYMLPGPA
jgi:hypothetical protein